MSLNKRRIEEDLPKSEKITDDEFLMDLFFLFVRKWKFIAGVTVVTVALAVLFTLVRPTLYEAETTLIVSSGQLYSVNNLRSDEITRNQQLVSTYAEIAKSRSIMTNVISKLDLDMDPDEVAKLLKMEPLGETELIKISFRDKNPKIAALFVDAVSREFIEKTREAMTFENLRIIEKAKVPERPLSKNLTFIGGASSVIGLLLGIFLVFAIDFLYGKLMKPEEIEKIMECQILANIPNYESIKKGEKNE